MHEGARAEKQRIRLETRLISEKLTPEYRQEASREIARQVLEHPLWKQAGTVMMYSSLPGEPDTRSLMETALREGKTLLLPRCLEAGRMEALPVKDPGELMPWEFRNRRRPKTERVSRSLIWCWCRAWQPRQTGSGWATEQDTMTVSWRSIQRKPSVCASGSC